MNFISKSLNVSDKWFQRLKGVLERNNLLNRPDTIFSVDEFDFADDPGRKQVIVKRSTRHPTSVHSGSGKNHTTLVMCTSARGE